MTIPFDFSSLTYPVWRIRKIADELRATRWSENVIPVDIELILEKDGL